MSLAHQIQPNGIAARAMAARGAGELAIELIRIDGGTQSRALLQDSVIEEYAAAIKEGVEFPPVVLFYDGADHWLADGFHRVRAFLAAGLASIPADVRQGTRRDAILYSVGANEAHGLRRTNDDKRRAVMTLLNDAEWSQWSDREIARQCAVGYTLVAKLRPDVTARAGSERTYTTKHGTVATMNTAAIGKTKEDEMYAEDRTVIDAGELAEMRRGSNKIVLPKDMSIEDAARQGLAREAAGESSEMVAKSLGIGLYNYRMACDVVFLFDRGGYSAQDTKIVSDAFRMMVDEQRVSEAREAIDPVAVKVWGAKKSHGLSRLDREPARVGQFEHAFGVITHTCVAAAELDLPYLSAEDAKSAVKELNAARRNLQTLVSRIQEIHNV